MKKKINKIYDLKLHEVHWIDTNCRVKRVPGGWIYEHYEKQPPYHSLCLIQVVFVPFSIEFRDGD